jgi:hypothetical protein
MLGTSVLPTAVVPLTAIPTFVEAGAAPCVRSIFASGTTEEVTAELPEELAGSLAKLVSEEANPNNTLGLARVEVLLPVALLDRGVVLIDTPGVGSTLIHNTEKAEAILPECDAALFVVSPDPPITEAEISYLTRIKVTVARLIIVLNKIDSVEPEDDEGRYIPASSVSRESRHLRERASIFSLGSHRIACQVGGRQGSVGLKRSPGVGGAPQRFSCP